MTTYEVQLDDDTAIVMKELCEEFGMDVLTAFTVFAKTVTREKRIPFIISADIPNKETKEAMDETDRILADPSSTKIYTDVHLMFKEILDDES